MDPILQDSRSRLESICQQIALKTLKSLLSQRQFPE